MKSGIYTITNLVNQKVYVGSSTNLHRREKDHFKKLSENVHPNTHLQNAVRIYNINNFIFQIIELCEITKLLIREQCYIDLLDSYRLGYNMCPIAKSTQGRKHSDAAKLKISLANTGRKHPGYVMSEETKKKLSIAHKGKKLSVEHRQKIKANLFTRIVSDETRKKLSLSKIGNQHTKGRILPQSQRDNISKGNIGKHSKKYNKKEKEAVN